jgi:type I restriction enzyme R subunit
VVEGIHETRRPDIVLFVNGIPFVILENKRRDKNQSIEEAISQHIRNQKKDLGIPRLFHYAQLLLAVQPNLVKYGVTGTPQKFWSVWKEDNLKQAEQLLRSKIYNTEPEQRMATHQDQSILALCKPSRLMELVYKFIVFDGPDKKIARYQQFFAVQETLKRISQTDTNGVRKGGVIWHTQGSGKSLTMVMLSKSIALDKEIKDPRVIIVTDRINLDKQIYKTFLNCGKNVKKARSGNHLIELLKDKGNENITCILDKFQTALKRRDFKDPSKNLFVLVDESHRSQYGSAHAKMKAILPNASYIGFTGTPLLKSEKSTARKFGGFIHKYTIDQAVEDEAVLPLLYEGRSAKLSVNKKQIDKGFERLSAPLSEEAQKDLKKKFATISRIYESDQVVEEIAFDISCHYCQNWQWTGFKAQLAVPKIDTAIRYQKYFEQQSDPQLKINTRVVFTPRDSRTGYEDVWEDASDEAKIYWNGLMEKFRGQDEYENDSIERFKDESDEVEIIIVVSKLLTGFDAPRNTVLYLAKPLVEHNLLQAIARVNRLFEGKEFGYIVDYVGILGKLDEALTQYSALEGFEEDDLKGTVIDIKVEINKVPGRLADLWDIFKGVDKKDLEALERHLGPKDIRDQFYHKLSSYARILQIGLSSDEFYQVYIDQQIQHFKNELKFFQKMRVSVQNRYAEVVNYKEYEPRVRKLLDTYVEADYIENITSQFNIFDQQLVHEALESYGKTPSSKADMIAHQMKKVITENLEKDEAYYKKFSDLIEETIQAFRDGRIDEQEYLNRVLKTRDDLQSGHQEGLPEILVDKKEARAFFGALTQVLIDHHGKEETTRVNENLAQAGIQITDIVEKLTIRDWKRNMDIQNRMENEIEDYLIEHRKTLGFEITFEEIDEILSKCLKVAKNNY